MDALRLEEWNRDPVLVQVDEPSAGPGQVVVRIGGSGVCQSDLHRMRDFDATSVPWQPPFTLGHENAGWVHELGAGVTGLAVGDPVVVYGSWGCGACACCRFGAETYCEDPGSAPVRSGGGGLGMDGGMAEYLLVPAARHLIALPAGLDPVTAAPLTDAGLTSYHAIRRSRPKLAPGSTAVVIGAGGLGHLAVQILKATTAARIIAVDIRAAALEDAQAAGADDVLLADQRTAAAIAARTGGLGADVVVDFVGSDQTLATAAASVRVLGDLTIVGIGGGTLPVSFRSMAGEVSVQATQWGTRPDLIEVVDLAARGLIRPHVTTYPLESALDVYRMLEAGQVQGRAVIVPGR